MFARDRLHGRARGGVPDPRPRDARPHASLRAAARGAARGRSVAARAITGELISSEIEMSPGPAPTSHDALARQREHRRRLFALARAGRRAGRHRHPSMGGLPRPADHRHRALPARRGGTEVRGVAQQHLQPARPCRGPRHRPGGPGLRPAAGMLPLLLAVSANSPYLDGATPGCTRRARRSSRAASRAAGCPTPSAAGPLTASTSSCSFAPLDRRVHAGVVVGAPALRLRHRRGADLRRADDRERVGGARGADRRLRGSGGARHR